MTTYAYIRVSTKEQNIERQLIALEPFGIPEENIFCDYCSGKNFDRPAYKELMQTIKDGDLVIIKSIDRLGRNYDEIIAQWQHITKKIHADILVLDMQLLDTRAKSDNLTGTLISDLVLQILAYVAQSEREFIHQRQAEGIAAAKAHGTKFGRTTVKMPENFETVCQACLSGEINTRKAAEILGISHSTFYRNMQKYKKK